MTLRVLACRGGRLLAVGAVALALLTMAAPAATAAAGASSGTGWLRLANLSPGAPTFDIYLYPIDSPHARLVLRNVRYGMVSAYQAVPAWSYTVAMRRAGKPPGSLPVLSATISVAAGQAYTLASMGPSPAPRLELLRDALTTPRGRAQVRIIQASLRQSPVTVTAGHHVLVRDLPFGSATGFATVTPGRWNLRAAGKTMTAADRDTWSPGTTYTVVVLDGASHLELVCLTDGAGSKAAPSGGAAMGFGGTAPRPASTLPWLAGMAGGGLLAAGGAAWLRRARPAA